MEENNKLVLAENIETAEEAASPVPHPIKKLPLTHSLPAKVAAFILTVISAFVFLGSAALGFLAFQSNFYTTSKEDIRKNNFMGEAERDAVNVVITSTMMQSTEKTAQRCSLRIRTSPT